MDYTNNDRNGGTPGEIPFFTAGAGVLDPNKNTNPHEENIDLSEWLPEATAPNQSEPTAEVSSNTAQGIGNLALANSPRQTDESETIESSESTLGKVVDIPTSPETSSQKEHDSKYPIEIVKILDDNKLSSKEVKSLEKEIKDRNIVDLTNMLNDIWLGSAESEAA